MTVFRRFKSICAAWTARFQWIKGTFTLYCSLPSINGPWKSGLIEYGRLLCGSFWVTYLHFSRNILEMMAWPLKAIVVNKNTDSCHRLERQCRRSAKTGLSGTAGSALMDCSVSWNPAKELSSWAFLILVVASQWHQAEHGGATDLLSSHLGPSCSQEFIPFRSQVMVLFYVCGIFQCCLVKSEHIHPWPETELMKLGRPGKGEERWSKNTVIKLSRDY